MPVRSVQRDRSEPLPQKKAQALREIAILHLNQIENQAIELGALVGQLRSNRITAAQMERILQDIQTVSAKQVAECRAVMLKFVALGVPIEADWEFEND